MVHPLQGYHAHKKPRTQAYFASDIEFNKAWQFHKRQAPPRASPFSLFITLDEGPRRPGLAGPRPHSPPPRL